MPAVDVVVTIAVIVDVVIVVVVVVIDVAHASRYIAKGDIVSSSPSFLSNPPPFSYVLSYLSFDILLDIARRKISARFFLRLLTKISELIQISLK